MTCEGNPFAISRTRTPCGFGEIVVDAYTDGEIDVAYLMRGDKVVRALRPGQLHALRVLVRRIGKVVPHPDLMTTGSRDTLRRDLGDLRVSLEELGLDLDVVVGSGYRLRGARTRVKTIRIGNVEVDVAGRSVSCDARRACLGEHAVGILVALAEHAMDAATLYRRVWGSEPYEIRNVVAGRVADLRDVLRRVGSRIAITTLTVHDTDAGRRLVCYRLRVPDRTISATGEQLTLFPLPVMAPNVAVHMPEDADRLDVIR